MTISAQNICRVWIIFRYLSYLMRLSACILQNLKDRAAVTFSYVMRPTGWKMIRHWQIRFVSLLMSFTHTIHLHLGFFSDFVLLKPLKCIMCRFWLPFLVHGASSCPVPQCRYFLVSPTPTYHRKKELHAYPGTIDLKFAVLNVFWCCRMIWKSSSQWWISQIQGFWGTLHIFVVIMK